MNTRQNPQAFPAAGPSFENGGDFSPGMDLRDYMAAAALPQAVEDYGQPAHGHTSVQRRDRGNPVLPYATQGAGTREEIIARQAYRYADAMLKARAKGGA